MAKRRVKTPEEMATRDKKKAYSFYLDTSQIDYLQKRADKAGVSVSKLVSEAITNYIEQIKSK